jgi:hypothetical protein
MPAKHPARPGTLGHLAESGRTVYIVCGKCGRFTVARLYEIAQRAGWWAPVEDVGKRLRCAECRYLGAKLTMDRPRVGQSVCPRCLRPYAPREEKSRSS